MMPSLRMRVLTGGLMVLASASLAHADTPLATTVLVSGLNRPVYICAAPNDATHMFILEKRGVIRVLDLTNNTINATNVMDITAKVFPISTTSTGNSDE